MGFELDPLEDIFAEDTVKNARAGGKFVPKAKPRPLRKGSTATSVSSLASVPTSDTAQGESHGTFTTERPSEPEIIAFPQDSQRNSVSVCLSSQNVVIERADTTVGPESSTDTIVPHRNYNNRASFDKSRENTDIFTGLESLDDFPPQDKLINILPAAKKIVEGSSCSLDAASVGVSSPKNAGLSVSLHSSADASTCPQHLVVQDPLTGGEPIILTNYGGSHLDNSEAGTEGVDIMDSQLMSDLTATSGRRSGKFQPKPKIQIQNKVHETCVTGADGLESASVLQESQSVPSEFGAGYKCSVPSFPPDDIWDFSAIEFTHESPPEYVPEIFVNEDPVEPQGTCQRVSGSPGGLPEFVPEMPVEFARAQTRKTRSPAAGRSLRPRKNRKNAFYLVDELDDEVHGDGESPAECPSGSLTGEGDVADEEFQVKSKSQAKKVKRDSGKPNVDKEKPARRRKAKEASDQAAKPKPKKFSHSSKRRQVDKALLETPEDEIDFQKVPLRDLILLAEHKEKLKKKEATGVTSTNESNGNPSEHYNEGEAFAFDQDGEDDHGQASPRVEECNLNFNYQTYMDKTPRVRWSKQDTELFYKAIRQFGTDLSMIQQLFPGRTRNQIKLKYKKEERQHPMRLREALTNRAKDHSHFEKVIEHLQQLAEENQNNNRDESVDLTGNEDAVHEGHEADEEELKSELPGGGENEEMTQEPTEMESPVKTYDSEDDLYRWSQYKSDI